MTVWHNINGQIVSQRSVPTTRGIPVSEKGQRTRYRSGTVSGLMPTGHLYITHLLTNDYKTMGKSNEIPIQIEQTHFINICRIPVFFEDKLKIKWNSPTSGWYRKVCGIRFDEYRKVYPGQGNESKKGTCLVELERNEEKEFRTNWRGREYDSITWLG